MKKSFLKKAATLLGAVILALPLATSALSANGVKAADEGAGATQHIILTKYGFTDTDKDMLTPKPRDTNKEWVLDDNKAEKLQGVEFKVYDVSKNYWENLKEYSENLTKDNATDLNSKLLLKGLKDKAIKTEKTDKNGRIELDLNKVSVDENGVKHAAVYLFHETNPRAGYNTSADFWLSLPAKAADDGNVYVYPKNQQKKTFEKKFKKIDSVTENPLAGAVFRIKKATDETGDHFKYVQLIENNGKGKKVPSVTGFADLLKDNLGYVLVDDLNEATSFVSDGDGYFGMNGFEDSDEKYLLEEVQAPSGYDKANFIYEKNKWAPEVKISEKDQILSVENTPTSLLPHTGGAGIIVFVVAGLVLVGGAVLVYSKRRHNAL